jgi:hypothetical protein
VIRRAVGGVHEYVGTPERLSVLRGICLTRDRHRCVISRKFDRDEAIKRLRRDGSAAQDDERNPLARQPVAPLEVAHILPHSLLHVDKGSPLVRPSFEKTASISSANTVS